MSYRSSSEHQHHHRDKATFDGGSSSGHHSFDRDSDRDDWNNRENSINPRANQVPMDQKPIERFYDSEPRKTLFIGRLAPITTEADLRKFFSRFGEIRSLHLIRDILTGDSRRYAFLEYSRSKEADRAYAEGNNATLDGRRILVDREHGREEKTSIKTLRRPNHRGNFSVGGGGGGGPIRHTFGGGRNFGSSGNDYSLSSNFPNLRSNSLHFNRGEGGRGGHYHPYNGGGGRSSNGNGSSYSNGGGAGRPTSSSSSSFSRSNSHHHHHHHHRKDGDDFDASIRSRMHGSNSGGYGPSYRRR